MAAATARHNVKRRIANREAKILTIDSRYFLVCCAGQAGIRQRSHRAPLITDYRSVSG